MNSLNKQRFEYLDGIRGVAALVVVLGHFKLAFVDLETNSIFYKFFWESLNCFFLSGNFCVRIFFVLSGYVLAYNSIYKDNFLTKQWLKRMYRLVVPIILTSFLYFLFSNSSLFYFKQVSTIHYTEWASSHWLFHYSFPQFVIRCLYDFMLFSDWQFVMNINSSLWTIPVELYWSYILFFCFFIIKMIKNLFLRNIFLLFYALSCTFFLKFIGIEYGVLFFAGTFFAINFKAIVEKYNTNLINFLSIFIVVILTYLVKINWINIIYFNDEMLINLMSITYILLAIRIQFIQKIFSNFIALWLGRISFSLYLLHLLIIGSISSKLYLIYPYLRSDIGLFILLIFTILISTLISHLYSVYIDEKLMKYYDQVYKFILNRFKNILSNIK